ncbi:hypothetical protein [Alkalihalobacterium chitinilyticum]|uniref:Uncharacterized protein n=1 Tax=Alkalihalobacterium chitinilyticum TaxID=2980103 RepID=A0ABT5VE12_9BACI|nr:hypothetical protein [Alkalihalobacterium chitinilyticum]MDE5413688.1 hypothetical protein [Alkalihalobacterium chitinilyticum]
MRKFKLLMICGLITSSLIACNNNDDVTETIEDAAANEEETLQQELPSEEDEEPIENEDTEMDELDEYEEENEGIDHHHELPFEWRGSYDLAEGTYTLKLNKNEHGDETMLIAFIMENSNIHDLDHHAAHLMEAAAEEVNEEQAFEAKHEYVYLLPLNEDETTFTFTITKSGLYALYLEHDAEEFDLEIFNENNEEITSENVSQFEGHNHGHDHDDHEHEHEDEHDHDH